MLRRPVLAALALLAAGLGAWGLGEATPQPQPFGETWTLEGADVDWIVPDLELQFFDGERLWATRGARIWVSSDAGGRWERRGVAEHPQGGLAGRIRAALARSRAGRWLRPARSIQGLIVLDDGAVLLSAPPVLQRSTDGGRTFVPVHRHRPQRGVLRQWDARGDLVAFAEYGLEGGEHAIWQSEDGGASWAVAWTLPPRGEPGGGRHLHGVQIGPSGDVWAMVGDRDEDARIGRLRGGGLEAVVAGDQRAKATSLVFDGGGILWGADAPPGPWGLFRWSPEGGLEAQQALPGPVLWIARTAGGVAVATEVEGDGVDGAELWFGPARGPFRRLLRAPAWEGDDALRGTISFPLGAPAPAILGTVERLGRLERAAIRVAPR